VLKSRIADSDVPVSRSVRISDNAMIDQLFDLLDAVGDSLRNMKIELPGYFFKRNLVVPGILGLGDILDAGVGNEFPYLFDDHGFHIIFFSAADIEDVIGDFFFFPGQCQLDRPGKIPDVAIRPPELLAEDGQFSAEGEFFGEFVDGQVKAHAGRDAVDRRKPQADGAKNAVSALSAVQYRFFHFDLEFGIQGNRSQWRSLIDIAVGIAHLAVIAACGGKDETFDLPSYGSLQQGDRSLIVDFPGQVGLFGAGGIANDGRQMNDVIDRITLEHFPDRVLRTDIAPNQAEIVSAPDVDQRFSAKIEFIKNDDAIT